MKEFLVIAAVALTTTFLPTQARTEPIAEYLMRHGATERRAHQVAKHIHAEAARHRIDPALVAAIVTVENPLLSPTARSRAGALGLMQVIPKYTKPYQRRCGRALTDDRTNLCIGIQIYQKNLEVRKTVVGALLGYNGCRSRTAKCGRYATIVLRHRAAVAQLITDTAGTG